MALVLDATVGGSLANAYVNVAAADLYFEARLHAEAWHALTTLVKTQALIWATRLIDERVAFFGAPATTGQALRCPRVGLLDRDGRTIASSVLPLDLQHATCELARWLTLSDRTAEPDTAEYAEVTVGALSVTFNPVGRVGLLPALVADMLAPYGVVSRSRRPSVAQLVRV